MRKETALIAVVMALGTTRAWAGPTRLTGTVGDAMCGLTHMVKGDDARCTRLCVDGGAEYALIVKDTAYTLKANATVKSELKKFANQRVTVTGTQSGRTIEVTSVHGSR